MNDFRYALRILARNPGFTLAVVLLLSLGIGANTALFSALNALLLRPLPVRHPEQLIRMVQIVPRVGVTSGFPHEYYDNLKHAGSFSAVFGQAEWPVAMDDPQPAEEVRVHVVTPEFFDVLGVRALYGRALNASDAEETPGPPPAVLSYNFWQRRFAADPRVVGRAITLRGHKFLVAGVMPRAFNGITTDTAPDLRIPVRAFPLLRFNSAGRSNGIALEVAARLKPGVTLAQAREESLAMLRTTLLSIPGANAQETKLELERFQIESLERGASILRERFGLALQLLAGSAGLLLLLMCSNVAGLLLTRGASRREEIAVRLAMGASRGRLIRQMLAESSLLAACGAAGGWLVAYLSLPLLMAALPPMRDRGTTLLALTLNVTPDRRVLLFAMAVAVATALLFGLAPAISASRVSLDGVLRGTRGTSRSRGRAALVVLQVALCTLLLSGAVVLVRSFERLHGLDPGFDRDHIVTFKIDPGLSGYTEAASDKLRLAMLDRVRAIPGVAAAATSTMPLMRGSGMKTTVAPEGRPTTEADFLNTSTNTVSPEYFNTMGMRILAGRALDPSDHDAKPQHAVINQTFASHFFPNSDPVGRRFGMWGNTLFEVVGVVNDAKYRSLREPIPPVFYTQGSHDVFSLYVRTRMLPATVIQPVRRELAALDPALPVLEIHTLSDEVDASAASERLTATLASLFGFLAGVLASVGIYGLVSFGVTQRRREIGIRMALGARPGDIGGMLGRQALVLATLGIAAGLAAARAAVPLVKTILYGAADADPASLAFAAASVLLITLAATAVPAARGAALPPASALRDER